MVITVTVTTDAAATPPPGREKFRAFLDENQIGPREAAKALKVTHAAVIGWRDGKSTPNEPARAAIEVWTGGMVLAADWASAEEKERNERFADVKPFERPATGTDGPH